MKSKNNDRELIILSHLKSTRSVNRFIAESPKFFNKFQALTPNELTNLVADFSKLSNSTFCLHRFGEFQFTENCKFLDKLNKHSKDSDHLKKNFKIMNSGKIYENTKNKWVSHQLMAKFGIDTPPSQLILGEELLYIKPELPFVIKSCHGSQGQNVFLVETENQIIKMANSLESDKPYIIQNFYSECRGKDLRVLILRDGTIFPYERIQLNGDFRSNISLGGIAKMATLSSEESLLVEKCQSFFSLDYAGIDILRTKNGPLILEINSSPGFKGAEEIYQENIAQRILQLFF